MDESE